MDLMEVREAIVSTIQPVLAGWTGYPVIVDQFSPPAFFVGDVSDWVYGTTFDGGVKFTIVVRYAVQRVDEIEAHKKLSAIISPAPGSPFAAIEANPRLNGLVDNCIVARVGRMARYRTGSGDSYLGLEQELEIEATYGS